jgi:hypothetical protein
MVIVDKNVFPGAELIYHFRPIVYRHVQENRQRLVAFGNVALGFDEIEVGCGDPVELGGATQVLFQKIGGTAPVSITVIDNQDSGFALH